jgi:uroporphyrinogen-III decarboxylase
MDSATGGGRRVVLDALAGRPTPRVPFAPITWGFEYYWVAAGLEPWQLACGSTEQWHRAHLAILERHGVDGLFYTGAGTGPREPRRVEETRDSWVVEDGNTGRRVRVTKGSLTATDVETGRIGDDAVGEIRTRADAARLVPEFAGWGKDCLDGLTHLIRDAGERALVLPHHSPGYICACYAFGFERAMEAMLVEPDLFRWVADRYADGDRLRMRELAAAGAEAVYIADGWASVDIISPAMFREFALPYQRSIALAAREAGLKVVLWNEGDVRPLLADEAALPIDAFAIEQSRKSVELELGPVRAAFGPRRCLFGNLDAELLLLRGDPEEIAEAARSIAARSGAGSPLVMSTGSPLPSNVSPAAVDAAVTAVRSLRP